MALHNISVGVDGSPASTDAFAWAHGLARTTSARLRAVHVWQTPFVCTYPWSSPSAEEAIAHARAVISDTLVATEATGHVESHIVRGAAGPALAAESSTADLIVVGRTGEALVEYKPEFGEVMVGSTARYCAHHARVPVAAVPPGSTWSDAPTVVVGIDGSPTSLAALTWATGHLPKRATIHAVRAVVDPTADGIAADYELLDPVVATHKAELQAMVDAALHPDFAAAGRSVISHVVLGYARDGLIDPGFPLDLIVVGEHGETAVAEHVLGSVSDHTLRYAPVPVIIVPSPARTPTTNG